MEVGPTLERSEYAVPSRPLPKPKLCGVGGSTLEPLTCSVRLRCATSFSPRTGQSPLDLASPPQPAGWSAALAPGEGDNAAECTGHLDQKYNTLAKQGAAWLKLPVRTEHGLLVVCEGPFSARSKLKVEYVNSSAVGGNAALELDGRPAHYARKLSKSLCSVVAEPKRLAKGDHTLALLPTSPTLLTGLSHVIWA